MNNQATIEKLQALEQKIHLLINEHASLKKELKNEMDANINLRQEVFSLNEDLKNFHNQDKISKIVSSVKDDSQNVSELKIKLNEYIKEIDNCIAHLNE
ncbi:MAG: hypothetical protein ACK4ND_18855 [Cytophagaceae bacterium]